MRPQRTAILTNPDADQFARSYRDLAGVRPQAAAVATLLPRIREDAFGLQVLGDVEVAWNRRGDEVDVALLIY